MIVVRPPIGTRVHVTTLPGLGYGGTVVPTSKKCPDGSVNVMDDDGSVGTRRFDQVSIVRTWTPPEETLMNGPHGHVVPRSDGAKARCMGPSGCSTCQAEVQALTTVTSAPACPACGQCTLTAVGRAAQAKVGGPLLVCQHPGCPRPLAAAEILADGETEHVVEFTDTGWTLRHPLAERLDDALMTCTIGQHLHDSEVPFPPNGKYRARLQHNGHSFSYVELRPVT